MLLDEGVPAGEVSSAAEAVPCGAASPPPPSPLPPPPSPPPSPSPPPLLSPRGRRGERGESRSHRGPLAASPGSYRRGKESSGDVDVLITRRDGGRSCDLLPRVCAALSAAGHEMHHLHDPFEKKEKEEGESCSYMGIVRLEGYATHRRLDLKASAPARPSPRPRAPA